MFSGIISLKKIQKNPMQNTLSCTWIKRQQCNFFPDVAENLTHKHQKLLYILDRLNPAADVLQTSNNSICHPKEIVLLFLKHIQHRRTDKLPANLRLST